MKLFACIKQVPGTETKIKINSDASDIDRQGIKWVMNPYDEFAVEEAVKIKSENAGSTLTVVTLGPKARTVDTLRTALAMGADDAIAIDAPENTDTLTTAKALAAAIKAEGEPAMVLTGKLAIDDNAAAVSQALAEFLGLPHATVVSTREVSGETTTVEREIEGGAKEVVALTGAAVIGANKGLNKPRYPNLPGIMKAKKKPLKEISLSDLGVEPAAKVVFPDYQLPPEKPPVKMIEGDAAAQSKTLVDLLRNEAKVL